MLEYLTTLDQTILFEIQHNLVNTALNPYMIALSKTGNLGIIWIISGIVFLFVKKYRCVGVAVLLALVITMILGSGIIKPLVARARPCITSPWMPMLISTPLPTSYSFPSGHTFASFSAATAIFLQSKRLGIIALSLAIGIGFSRMYLFVHYPTDVLTGALLGTLSGIIAYRISRHLMITRPY